MEDFPDVSVDETNEPVERWVVLVKESIKLSYWLRKLFTSKVYEIVLAISSILVNALFPPMFFKLNRTFLSLTLVLLCL